MIARGAAAIVGAAESDLGEVAPGTTPVDLMAQGVCRALDDCGLALKDVDGVIAASSQLRNPVLGLCDYLGVKPRYMDSTQIGGSSFMTHLVHAHAAVETGLCDIAVIAHGSTQRQQGGLALAAPREFNPFETPFGPRLPASAYALAAARHMHEFGTTREHLAEVAVAARQWALLNPAAWEKKPLSIDDVLSSRMVSSPLTVRDCCLVSDGGGALVVARADRAKSLRKAPVFLLGAGEAVSHHHISGMADLTTTAAVDSGRSAFSQAGLDPSRMDVVELYDAFTINTILFLEDLGFCEKGEGGWFVSDGAIAPGGRLAVNTNGGGLSYCHPGMYGLLLLIEAVRQIRGECGERQAGRVDLALAHGNGGVLSSQCTVILGSNDAL